MTSLTQRKLSIYLTAIFIAGGVSGAFVGYNLRSDRQRPFTRPSPDQMIGFVQEKLTTEVGISPEQWVQIAPIITNSVREIHELDSRNRQRLGELIARSDAQVMEKLTAEQKPRMQRWIAERHGPSRHRKGEPKQP